MVRRPRPETSPPGWGQRRLPSTVGGPRRARSAGAPFRLELLRRLRPLPLPADGRRVVGTAQKRLNMVYPDKHKPFRQETFVTAADWDGDGVVDLLGVGNQGGIGVALGELKRPGPVVFTRKLNSHAVKPTPTPTGCIPSRSPTGTAKECGVSRPSHSRGPDARNLLVQEHRRSWSHPIGDRKAHP